MIQHVRCKLRRSGVVPLTKMSEMGNKIIRWPENKQIICLHG